MLMLHVQAFQCSGRRIRVFTVKSGDYETEANNETEIDSIPRID